MIRIEALRVFVTVAECGNIGDAGARLHRTPSAISMTLKQIEERLGAPLFESDRKNSLTDFGHYVRRVASVLLRDYDHAMEVIADRASSRSGRLAIASVPSVAALLIPTALQDFLQARPGARIDLVDTDSAGVHALVEQGEAELGIASPPARPAALVFQPLFRDPFRVICAAGSALSRSAVPLSWSGLEDEEMIVNEAMRELTSPELQRLAAKARLFVRNVTSLQAMVRGGAGITLLPALGTVALPPSLCALPLADPTALRTVGLVTRPGRVASPLAAAFRDHFEAALGPQLRALGLEPAS